MPLRPLFLSLFVGVVSASCASPDSSQAAPARDSTAPAPAWLVARGDEERKLAAASSAFHDFSFADRLGESGITFVHHTVDDAAKEYKAVHYDHGSGLAAADVDGDGRPDLFFPSQLGTSELWRNVGGGRFQNITGESGIDLRDATAVGASFGDFDNDGDPDLFVTTVRHGNRLFENIGHGKFKDVSAAAGVSYSGHSSGAVWFDYDRDGLLDLFVANVGVYTSNEKRPDGHYAGLVDAFHGHMHPDRAEPSILYHNLGAGRFEDVTRQTHLVDPSWTGDAVAFDANRDGWPDLYVLDMQGRNHLWLNEAGKSFRDGTAAYFAKTPWGAMGAKPFDANGDGALDLLVTDMHSDMFTTVAAGDWVTEGRKSDSLAMPAPLFPEGKKPFVLGNALFTRAATSSGTYRDLSDSLGVEMYWPWGPSVDDLNADGWDDVFITAGMSFPFRYAPNSLLLNENGKHFLPAEFTLGVEPRAHGWSEWFSVDCNGEDRGNPSCAQCAQPGSEAVGCRETSPGKFTLLGSRSSRSAVIADFDGDGDLDIVTNEFNHAPMVFMSDLAARRRINWLEVRLRGTKSNREGIGAQVTVMLRDGRHITKLMDGKSGYLGQSDLPLYFGLGDQARAVSIEVIWPSGSRQLVSQPISKQVNEVVEAPTMARPER
jgi:hypothetical protein